jgi:osmotically-inducible protein OsmY
MFKKYLIPCLVGSALAFALNEEKIENTGSQSESAEADRLKKLKKRVEQKRNAKNKQVSNRASDMELRRKIKSRILEDTTLSKEARQVRVNVQSGNITLRGIVKNEDEKIKLENYANILTENKEIKNELVIENPALENAR